MPMTETDGQPETHAVTDERDNLTRLLNLGRRKRPRINRRYSFFVRGMRLLLPLASFLDMQSGDGEAPSAAPRCLCRSQ